MFSMLTFLMGGKSFFWKSSLVFKSIFVVFWGLKFPILISANYLTKQMCVNGTKSQVLIFVNLPCYGMLQWQVAVASRQQSFCPVWNFALKFMFVWEECM